MTPDGVHIVEKVGNEEGRALAEGGGVCCQIVSSNLVGATSKVGITSICNDWLIEFTYVPEKNNF